MYFRRKIDKTLDEWLTNGYKRPFLIVGIRQCGKTEAVREFAKRNNLELIELNFFTNAEYASIFSSQLDVDSLVSKISIRFPDKIITPKKTLLFFDEIQECPRARLSFKFFKDDGRYMVIGSGSYLGINGYVIGDSTPAPTGAEDVIDLKTMDFEEFLWANGYGDEHINELIKYFDDRQKIPNDLHQNYQEWFLKYTCIGGFPAVVKEYVETKNLMSAIRVLNSTVFDMKTDFGRRKDKNGRPAFKPSEVARIQNAFELIPTFLSKENKRFVVSKINHGSSKEKSDAIEFLKQAHIVYKVNNLEIPSLPLLGHQISSQFKLFPGDIGIVMSMYGIDTVLAVLEGNLGQGKGAIYEAVVFDALNKAGFTPFYFAKESGLEIDFVIAYRGESFLVEVKARNGNAKSSRTVMSNPDHYGKTKLLKIGNYNISEEGDILTIPHYLCFVLGRETSALINGK